MTESPTDLFVVAFDPGFATGIASTHEREHVATHAAYRPDDDAWGAMDVARQMIEQRPDAVCCESIHINNQTHKKGPQVLSSVEQIGILRYYCRCYGVPFHLQSPSEAKSFSTDLKLKAAGWWTKGVDHPRDASRHLMLYLCRNDSAFRDWLVGRI